MADRDTRQSTAIDRTLKLVPKYFKPPAGPPRAQRPPGRAHGVFRRHVSQLVLVVITISDIAIFDLFVSGLSVRSRALRAGDRYCTAPQVAELEQRVGARDHTWCVKEARTPDFLAAFLVLILVVQTTTLVDTGTPSRGPPPLHSFTTTPKHRSIEPPIRLLTHHRSLPVHSFAETSIHDRGLETRGPMMTTMTPAAEPPTR